VIVGVSRHNPALLVNVDGHPMRLKVRGRDVDEPTVVLRREWVCFSPNWHRVQEEIAPTVRSSRTTEQDLAEAGPLAGQRDAQTIAMELRDAASHRRTKQAPKEGGSVGARPLPGKANPALLQHTRREGGRKSMETGSQIKSRDSPARCGSSASTSSGLPPGSASGSSPTRSDCSP
jgi:hypothetical protein